MSGVSVVERIWARDASVWTGGDEGEWLGWLDEPARIRERLPELRAFAEEVAASSVEAVVLLGMGGSSLGPEVFRRAHGAESFHVLDTTHPQAIRRLREQLDLERTLFISASKSGTTLETRSHTDYFWAAGGERGAAFAAITDPGSELESLAHKRGFRHVFPGEPSIGGRYSALSAFGLVPAALLGADLERLLDSTEAIVQACRGASANPGLELGLQLGEDWREGRDKICLDETREGFGLWAEQLIAESTGKQGKGLIPAPGEDPQGADRQPGTVRVTGPDELGAEFFRWEFGVAVAASILEINPFDQPNVQEAKDRTRQLLASGQEPHLEPEGSVDELLALAQAGDYVCIQAFIDPAEEARLEPLLVRARATGCVVTHGLGPRYLHSTGQLHKGGPPSGLFLQVVDETGDELEIPGQPFGFGALIRAQAAGDYQALTERGRRVARVRLEDI